MMRVTKTKKGMMMRMREMTMKVKLKKGMRKWRMKERMRLKGKSTAQKRSLR